MSETALPRLPREASSGWSRNPVSFQTSPRCPASRVRRGRTSQTFACWRWQSSSQCFSRSLTKTAVMGDVSSASGRFDSLTGNVTAWVGFGVPSPSRSRVLGSSLTDGCREQHSLNVPEGRRNPNMGHRAAHAALFVLRADEGSVQPKYGSQGSPLELSVGESLTTSDAGRAVWVASPSRSVFGRRPRGLRVSSPARLP